MKTIIIFFCAGIFSFTAKAQDKTDIQTNPKYIAFKKQHDDIVTKSVSSEYYGYDETLRSFFSNNTIPNSLPKSKTYTSKEEYRMAVNKWISENSALLKQENKNALLKD